MCTPLLRCCFPGAFLSDSLSLRAPAGEGRAPLERLEIERTLSINTAAAGSNASVMMIG
jgi:delta 1-pyrroline-5-carboxylate dehydrogenase